MMDNQQDALFSAIREGAYEHVLSLLEGGMSLNTRDFHGRTPLFEAVSGGQDAIVKLMLEHKADVNYPNRNGLTPFYKAVDTGNVAVAHRLLERGAHITKNISLLRAVESRDLYLVKCLIANGITGDYRELISVAAEMGTIAILRTLLLQKKYNLGNLRGTKDSPLVRAVKKGQLESVKLLLHSGAAIGSALEEPLPAAAKLNRVDIMEVLIAHGAKAECDTLRDAMYKDAVDAARFLIEKHGIYPTASTLNKAIYAKKTAIVPLLVEWISDINKTNVVDSYCLVTAVREKHAQAVRLLLERKDLSDAHRKEGFLAALEKQDPEILQLFDAQLNDPYRPIGSSALKTSANTGSDASLSNECYFQPFPVTKLADAVKMQSIEIVQSLLKEGVTVLDQVLEEAVMANSLEEHPNLPLLQLLLEHSIATPALIKRVLERYSDTRYAVVKTLLTHCVQIDEAYIEWRYKRRSTSPSSWVHSGVELEIARFNAIDSERRNERELIPLFIEFGAKVSLEDAVSYSKNSAVVKNALSQVAQDAYYPAYLLEAALENYAPVEIVHMLMQDLKRPGIRLPKEMPKFLATALRKRASLDAIKLLIVGRCEEIDLGYELKYSSQRYDIDYPDCISSTKYKNAVIALYLTRYDTSDREAFFKALPAEISKEFPDGKEAVYLRTLCLKPLMALAISAEEALSVATMLASHKELLLGKGQEISQLEQKIRAYIHGYQSLRYVSNVAKDPFSRMSSIKSVLVDAIAPDSGNSLTHLEKLKLWEVMKSPHNTTATCFFEGLLACLEGKTIAAKGASLGVARAS